MADDRDFDVIERVSATEGESEYESDRDGVIFVDHRHPIEPVITLHSRPAGLADETTMTDAEALIAHGVELRAQRKQIESAIDGLSQQLRRLKAREKDTAQALVAEVPTPAISDESAFDWIHGMTSMQIREFLITLNANATGSSEVLRDRLYRALRRTTDPSVVWTTDDQPLPSRELMNSLERSQRSTRLVSSVAGSRISTATTTTTTTTTVTTSTACLLTGDTGSIPVRPPQGSQWHPITSTGLPSGQTWPIPSPRTHRVTNHVNLPPAANSTVIPAVNRALDATYSPIASPQRRMESSRSGEVHYQPAMYERVSKWNLKFTGHGSSRVETFLNRLEECRETCGLSDADVLAIMPLLLSGAAKTWWGHKKRHVRTYDQFCVELRDRFGEAEVECRILSEVVTRTQGPLESGLDYLDAVLSMWALVSEPLPEGLKLSFAFNNLRTEYHSSIRRGDFTTFDQLYRLVRDFDSPRRRKQPRMPMSPDDSVVPELAYHPERYETRSSKKTCQAHIAVVETSGDEGSTSSRSSKYSRRGGRSSGVKKAAKPTRSVQGRSQPPGPSLQLPPAKSSAAQGSQIAAVVTPPPQGGPKTRFGQPRPFSIPMERRGRCFNCKQPGHGHNECPLTRRTNYCWTCGAETTPTPGCPNCLRRQQRATTTMGNASGNQQ